eukprot:3097583-Amphidinium_carterae.1
MSAVGSFLHRRGDGWWGSRLGGGELKAVVGGERIVRIGCKAVEKWLSYKLISETLVWASKSVAQWKPRHKQSKCTRAITCGVPSNTYVMGWVGRDVWEFH